MAVVENKIGFIEKSESRAGFSLAAKLLADLRLLILTLWLGGALFFVVAVAPSAFAVLSNRELAGAVVNRTLAVVNVSGFFVGAFLLLTAFVFRQTSGKIRLIAESVCLALITILCAVGNWVIAAQMQVLRTQTSGAISDLPKTDAIRVAFDNLHVYSVQALGTAMICALVAYFLIKAKD